MDTSCPRSLTQISYTFVPLMFLVPFYLLKVFCTVSTLPYEFEFVVELITQEPACNDNTAITIHTRDSAKDNMTPNPDVCPKLPEYSKQFQETKQFQEY